MAKQRDQFNISEGNLMVLETISRMMLDKKWRAILRTLTMDYIKEEKEKNERRILKNG